MLTRKDFQATAALITQLPVADRTAAALRYAETAFRSNYRFDWGIFAKACHLPTQGSENAATRN